MLVGGPALVIGAVATSGSAPADDQAPVVTEVTRQAMEAMQQVGSIEGTSVDPDENAAAAHPAGDFPKADRPDLRRLDMSRVAKAQGVGRHRLAQYFTGRQLGWLMSINDDMQVRYRGLTLEEGAPGSPAADPSATSDYIITGGVDDFDGVRAVMSDDEATVTGMATIWSNSAMVQPESTVVDRIDGVVSFTAHLVRVGGAWKVDKYNDDLTPGTEP